MSDVFDKARAAIDAAENRFEGFVLSRDPDFRASLAEADEQLAAGNTGSLADLRRELASQDERPSVR